jgi:hypothetical protein
MRKELESIYLAQSAGMGRTPADKVGSLHRGVMISKGKIYFRLCLKIRY